MLHAPHAIKHKIMNLRHGKESSTFFNISILCWIYRRISFSLID